MTIPAAKNLPRWRLKVVAGTMLGLWMIVAARLVHIQHFQAEELSSRARRQQSFEVEVPARPADIVDRNGNLLATTITTPSLFVDPSQLDVDPTFIEELCGILNLDPAALTERLAEYSGKRFCWIKRRLSEEELTQVIQLEWPDGSYGFRQEFLRQYPQGHVAAHVLGLRNIDGEGKGGVEQSLNHLVQGRPGKRQLVRDAMGRIVEVSFDPDSEPRRFDAVALTIDLPIQMVVERELDRIMKDWEPKAASAIVLDPQSGDILAMSSRPNYSPSDLSSVNPEAWKNQAINIVYEPGSTFKPLVVAWALQHGMIERDEILHCENGQWKMGRRLLNDHHPYGKLSLTDVLVKSSNIGMAKIGTKMTNAELFRATVAFGFGRPTGVDLPGEVSGIVRPLRKWNSYSTGSVPMGQEIAVTPMQLIAAHASLANGGRLITPQLLRGVRGHGDDENSPFYASEEEPGLSVPARLLTKTVDAETAQWVVENPMTEVVKRGTGRRAKVEGYEVFGKTGTAQKTDPETGGYSATDYVASFVCGAPARNPRVLVLVVVDEPPPGKSHQGGIVAAPSAARILRRTLLHLHVSPETDDRAAERPTENGRAG
jgi:cell division protein FtsI (penicillin-binding protein 3)